MLKQTIDHLSIAMMKVAFEALKLEQLDYQFYIIFFEDKAIYYQFYNKGEDGEVR